MSARVQGKPASGIVARFGAAFAVTGGAGLVVSLILALAGLPFLPMLVLALLAALFVTCAVTR